MSLKAKEMYSRVTQGQLHITSSELVLAGQCVSKLMHYENFNLEEEWIYREKSLETTLWVISNRDYVDEQVFNAAETGLFCMNAGKPVLWKQRLRLLSKWFRDNATLLCVSIPRANFKCKLPLVGYKNQLLGALRMKILICAPGHLGWQKSVDSIRTPLGLVHCLIPDDEHLNLGVPNLDNAPVHFCGELSDPSVSQGCARGNGTFEMELHSLALQKWQNQTPNGAYHTFRDFSLETSTNLCESKELENPQSQDSCHWRLLTSWVLSSL